MESILFGGSGGFTNHCKRLESFSQFVLDILWGIWVVIRQQGILEEGDLVLGRVKALEFGLGYALVVIKDCYFDWRRHGCCCC